MKLKENLVSIICPLFNKEKYIVETIDSVLKQTYLNWELIIVDDGSTDKSIKLVEKYKNSKLTLIRRQDFKNNKGASVCRNIGLEKAKGDLVIFLDADDILAPYCIEQRVKAFQNFVNNDVLIFNFYKLNFNNVLKNRITEQYDKIRYKSAKDKREYMLKRFLMTDYFWQTSSALWKKETLLKVNGFTESFLRFQDPELHIRVLLDKSIKIKILKFKELPDFYYRIDENRENINEIEKYKRLANHLKHFVTFITEELCKRGREDLLKNLASYLLLIEVDKPKSLSKNYKIKIEKIYFQFYRNLDMKNYLSFKFNFYKNTFKLLNSLNLYFFKRFLYLIFKKLN